MFECNEGDEKIMGDEDNDYAGLGEEFMSGLLGLTHINT
jgi:hypothetical protein